MSINIDVNATAAKLTADVKDTVLTSEPKHYSGNADYFTGVTACVIDSADYELGDREYLKNSIAYRLRTTRDAKGKLVTNWGYKRVLQVVEKAFKYVNKP
ncbi:hypothetical protein [Vibrio ziniensis]|uniref:Uncharacterized protein n=1 Tax=Vibrio ziniensis TaxID=2711221 RepID=A0A6G7CFG4_9VIBR|nr:hypothetical protein [Vibrio ziniensis]QIH40810.1 hypothetical protein G5S32_01885 [Vibrio ziniensis]